MKVGALVTIKGSFPKHEILGVLLELSNGRDGWWSIMTKEGIVNWPHSQMSVINESR